MSGEGGWEDLFAPLGDEDVEQSPVAAPAPSPSNPADAPQPFVDPFAEMRATQAAAQAAPVPVQAAPVQAAPVQAVPAPAANQFNPVTDSNPATGGLTRREMRARERAAEAATGATEMVSAEVPSAPAAAAPVPPVAAAPVPSDMPVATAQEWNTAALAANAFPAGPGQRVEPGAIASAAMEDWRPRPMPGGGFPIPLRPGSGIGGSGGSGGRGHSGGKRPARRSRRWLAIVLPILVLIAAVGGTAAWAWMNHEDKVREILGWQLPNDFDGTGNGQEVIVTIRSGDIGSDVAVALHRAGVTKSFDAFYKLLLTTSPEPTFEPGNYSLQQQMSARAALEALQNPASRITTRLIIPEGSVLSDVLEIMAATTGIPLKEFQDAAATPQAFGVPANAPSLEGYLFPAVYDLDGNETPKDLIQRLVTEMFTRLDAAGVAPDDRHRLLTLASMVQRESGPNPEDPPKIARVFLNRLDQGMKLESDATVTYGTGNYHTVWTTQADRDDASNPYNTYANPGLPIGPIAMPGEAAIAAAQHPADGPWLYFVAVNLATGETMFSETLQEHEHWVDVLFQWCEQSDENAAYCS